MALVKVMQERGHETVFFNIVDRDRTITEHGLGFVPYGHEEYPAGSLAGIFEKIDKLKGVMLPHKVNSQIEHRMAKEKFFEAGEILD